MDKIEETNEWLKFSERDLSTAEYLYENMRPIPLEIICYLCQQSAEKMLKAFLVYHEINPPRTHDLNDLKNLCKNINVDFDEINVSCKRLTDYGVQPRYPMGDEITDGDTKLALQDSKKTSEFVKEKINIKNDMLLTQDLKNMGFILVDTEDSDVNDYMRVKKLTQSKYIYEHINYFGEWNDEIQFNEFFQKRGFTFFKKLLLNNETAGFLNYDQKETKIDDVSIYIIEKAQNNGIGTLFLLTLIKLSKKFKIPIFIEVIKTNPAQNLYKRLGFELYKEKDVFYNFIYNP